MEIEIDVHECDPDPEKDSLGEEELVRLVLLRKRHHHHRKDAYDRAKRYENL